jgi:hypothetical protein
MTNENRNKTYTHILKYTGLFGGVQGLGILVGIVRNKLVALLLGAEGMGLMSLFNSTTKLISDSTNFGLSMSAVRELSAAFEQHDETYMRRCIDSVRLWIMLTALLGMAVCMVMSPILSQWVFGWGDHSLHFVLLSIVVFLMAVTGGELAILKALRQLKSLAKISFLNIVGALITSIPLFYIWRQAAIVPSLIIVALTQMLLTIYYSHRQYAIHFNWSKTLLLRGSPMLKIGVAFVLAGILGSGADFLIRRYLNVLGSVETVGLFNAAYMMTMTYAGLVFSAMETDFFPRLSSIKHTGALLNETVNSQIEVSLLLISPMLVVFMVGVPVLLPLLYSREFVSLQVMVQTLVLAMYWRAVKLPIAYIPLAKGNSRLYLLVEAIYDVVLVLAVIAGFHFYELLGAGIAITLVAVLDFLMLYYFMHTIYQYNISYSVWQYLGIQLIFGLGTYGLVLSTHGWLYWGGGVVLVLLSLWVSLRILRKKTDLWTHLKLRVWKK